MCVVVFYYIYKVFIPQVVVVVVVVVVVRHAEITTRIWPSMRLYYHLTNYNSQTLTLHLEDKIGYEENEADDTGDQSSVLNVGWSHIGSEVINCGVTSW